MIQLCMRSHATVKHVHTPRPGNPPPLYIATDLELGTHDLGVLPEHDRHLNMRTPLVLVFACKHWPEQVESSKESSKESDKLHKLSW